MKNVLNFTGWNKLNEGNGLWDQIQGGSSGKGLKVKHIDFASNYQLTSPTDGGLFFDEKTGEIFKNKPAYIGAHIQMQYNQLADMNKVNSASDSLKAQFGFDLNFYLTTNKGETVFVNDKPNTALYFTVNGAKLKSGEFQILAKPTYSTEFEKIGFKTEKGVRIPMKNTLATNMLFGNLDKWIGELRMTINKTLRDYGYPSLPNTLKYKEAQIV
jgi:hypothetical protein